MNQNNPVELNELRSVYNQVQTVRRVLLCSGEEGAIVTGCAGLLISCAVKANALRTVIEQQGVTEGDVELGDWRVIIERIKAP